MTYARGIDTLKKAALVAGMVALPVLGWQAYAQVAPDRPIEGTIRVMEDADLAALAKVTLEQAKAAALAAVPGATFAEGELEEEDGYLVYEVELVQDGRELEVVVDAGNAAVLETEPDDDRDDD